MLVHHRVTSHIKFNSNVVNSSAITVSTELVAECITGFFLVDGGFAEWGNYTTCSVTCGGGNEMRMRTCTNPVPQNGGKPCYGPTSESRECNTQPCPGKEDILTKLTKCSELQ